MPRINIFNGGMRTAQAPHLIKENESVALVNCNHISGILEPLNEKVLSVTGAKKWGHFFTINTTWYWSDTPKDYIEFQERLYIGNRTGTSTKILNNVEYNMGIQPPTSVPTVVVSNETPEDKQITRLDLTPASTGGNIPSGVTLQYKAVNIDASGNYYPSDSRFSIAISSGTSTNQVTVNCTDTNVDVAVAYFRYFDGTWRRIYEGPPAPYVDNNYDISSNPTDDGYEASGLNGTYQYALTFYNTADGTESAPVLSAEFTVGFGTATVGNLEISLDPQVDARRLYRIGGSSTAFTLVEQIDNVVTEYIDTLADDELEGSLMTAEQNYPPVDNLKYMMESYAMFFAADGDKLRFTPIGEPDYWPQTYYLDFPRPITGLAKTPIGILVFNEFETWLVTGTGPLSLAQQLLTGSQGCINGDTVVNISGSALWASLDGICMSNGGEVGVITRDKLDKLTLDQSVNAVVYDDRYYILMLELGTVLMLDLERQVIQYKNYDYIRSLNVANDTLYGFNDGYLYELEPQTTETTTPMLWQYGSPVFIGRGYTVPKTYKNFYVYSEGEVTVLILVDGNVVQDVTLNSPGNHQIKIPTDNTRAYSIQFFLYGTGTVYEVYWEDGNANQ